MPQIVAASILTIVSTRSPIGHFGNGPQTRPDIHHRSHGQFWQSPCPRERGIRAWQVGAARSCRIADHQRSPELLDLGIDLSLALTLRDAILAGASQRHRIPGRLLSVASTPYVATSTA